MTIMNQTQLITAHRMPGARYFARLFLGVLLLPIVVLGLLIASAGGIAVFIAHKFGARPLTPPADQSRHRVVVFT